MAIPTLFTFFPENDQIFQWGPLVSGESPLSNPTYVDDAAGTLTLYDYNGSPVSGATNLSFVYVPGSNGLYNAQIAGTSFNPVVAPNYSVVVTLTSPTYGRGYWTVPAQVVVRVSQ